MAALTAAAGVPPQAIRLEERARNTLENARYTSVIMREHGWRAALVVTDGFHLRRALFAFRAFGIVADGSAADEVGAMRDVSLLRLCRERAGLLWYGFRSVPIRLRSHQKQTGASADAPARGH